ncbi:MAG: hypothetical protein GY795_30915, partial [Desulfobacterales bacterium]|nr:hypothetical protein [Desulfobacterales bacterium]
MIPRKLSKSRALLGRRKSGKTAIMQRLFNILWNRNDKVIPFYFEVLQQDQWLLNFSDEYFRTFLSQYVSFKTRIPLAKENKPWNWDALHDMVTQIGNDKILRATEDFYKYLEKEDEHNTMRSAFGSPAEFTGYDEVFFVVMIDEIQYMTKHIYRDKDCEILFRNLPGGFHGLSELKYAPMLASGSYIGWMTQMIHEMFVGGRLKKTRVSPKLSFTEGMEAVFKYAEHYKIEITDRSALIMNVLTQSDPFYIATLFRSDWPGRDFSSTEGILNTFAYEILDRDGELFGTWSEYINLAIKAVNNIYGKKILLYLSMERHRECPRDEIRNHLGWQPEDDSELEKKLLTLEYGGLITRGSSDYHYKGIEDDILDLIFRERYQYEVDMVRPDVTAELLAKIRMLEDDRKSLEGKFRELKGRLLELIVWRELNKCRKENKPVKNFAKRMRKISDPGHAEKMKQMIELCAGSSFTTVWMNYYLQIPQTTSLEADVFAEGEDDETCWALIFETKNRDEKYLPTKDEARLFETKANMTKKILEQKGKKIRFVCPVYLSAKGFEQDIETWLHSRGILTADLETWEQEKKI